MINALQCDYEKWCFFKCGHSDNDHYHKDYDDVDGDGDCVGHSHINSDYDEYDDGD